MTWFSNDVNSDRDVINDSAHLKSKTLRLNKRKASNVDVESSSQNDVDNNTMAGDDDVRLGEYVASFPDLPHANPGSYSLYAKKLLKIAHILHYGSIAILGVFVIQVRGFITIRATPCTLQSM